MGVLIYDRTSNTSYGAVSNVRWQYAGAEGALVFCADKAKGGLWFRVVDLGVSCGGARQADATLINVML